MFSSQRLFSVLADVAIHDDRALRRLSRRVLSCKTLWSNSMRHSPHVPEKRAFLASAVDSVIDFLIMVLSIYYLNQTNALKTFITM